MIAVDYLYNGRGEMMGILRANEEDVDIVAPLIAKFRVELRLFKGIHSTEEIDSAKQEFIEDINAGYPIYIWKENAACLGYLVCRVDKPVVWVESLYVISNYRRKGIASALFEEAERLAASYGEDTVYNYVHPNNDSIIAFLRQRGYDVLNLIEIRKQHAGEVISSIISVGGNEFKY